MIKFVAAIAALALVLVPMATAETPQFRSLPQLITDGTPAVGETVRGDRGSVLYDNGTSCGSECAWRYEFWRHIGTGWVLDQSLPGTTDANASYVVRPEDAGFRLMFKAIFVQRDCGAQGGDSCQDITRSADSPLSPVVAGATPPPPPPPRSPDVAGAITALDIALAKLRASAGYKRTREQNPLTFPSTLMGQAESQIEVALYRLRP